MNEGGLVPFELTVQILINGLIANPSKNYLIDGFPRAVDQAVYFEQNVCECQNVLFYDVSEETLLERCLVRASNSIQQREDDNEETLKKRLRAFKELSKPVVEMYARFGKVKHIDASKSVGEVFEETKKAMLPQVFFMIGPKGSGKSTVATELANRTNMIVLRFDHFLKSKGFDVNDFDDEEATMSLVNHLVHETNPRVLIEDFPRNEKQARLFIKNCVTPSEVFYIRCAKDICQERLLEISSSHPSYVPSALLSKQVKRFYETSAQLIAYLKKSTRFFEINGEKILPNVLKEVYSIIEPTVIHIRTGGNASNDLRK
jgi:adenylate kinase family enzyme